MLTFPPMCSLASIMGHVATTGTSAYVSSKHLVMGLTKSAALDLAPHRVHINAICPGYVQSSLTAKSLEDDAVATHLNALHPFRGLGEPDDIARVSIDVSNPAECVRQMLIPPPVCS